MSEKNLEEEKRERCEEAKFVDENSAELIQKVTSVMAIADELHSKGMIHAEKYAEIKAEKTNQEKTRKLFESLNSGGDQVKSAFYYLLEKHQPYLFKDLGGVSRKRKLSDPEPSVPFKRLNTESIKQENSYYNNASNSAPRPAPAGLYFVNNIINEQRPPHNMDYIPIINKTVAKMERKPPEEWKPPALKKEKKAPVPEKEKKRTAPKKEKKTPAPKKETKTPAPKKEKKTPAPKKEKKTPAPKEKKPPAPKKEKKTPSPKKAKKPPAPKKAKKPPAPKKAKKPPAPKKAKKPPAPKKAKKPPAPKKAKKPPAPKKAKKPLAPKKEKKSAVRK